MWMFYRQRYVACDWYRYLSGCLGEIVLGNGYLPKDSSNNPMNEIFYFSPTNTPVINSPLVIYQLNIYQTRINENPGEPYNVLSNFLPSGTSSDNRYWKHIGAQWRAGSTYSSSNPDYCIGNDNNIYTCIASHVNADFSSVPPTGLFWQEFWELTGYNGRAFPQTFGKVGMYYTSGLICLGTDGRAYRCISTPGYAFTSGAYAGYVTKLPGAYTGWENDWGLANGPTWTPSHPILEFRGNMVWPGYPGATQNSAQSLIYKVNNPLVGSDGGPDTVIGTDGLIYSCIQDHYPALSNRPITGMGTGHDDDWTQYWTPGAVQSQGNNPVAIAVDILTNTFYGLGIPTDRINWTVANATAAYLNGKGYGLNFVVKDIGEARSVLNKMVDWCDLIVTIGNDGLIWLRAIIADPPTFLQNTGTTALLSLTDDDYASFSLSRQTWRDISNEFEASYSEPGRLYEPTSVVVRNEAAISMAGVQDFSGANHPSKRKKSIDLTAYTNSQIAIARLTEIMTRESYPRMTVNCEVDRRFYGLRPGDLAVITKAEYNIVNVVFLVTKVTLGKLDENTVQLELIEPTVTQQWTGRVTGVLQEAYSTASPWQETITSTYPIQEPTT